MKQEGFKGTWDSYIKEYRTVSGSVDATNVAREAIDLVNGRP
jgi:hypothetical protein